LQKVTLDDWKKAMDKGISRVAGGAEAALPKMEEFMKDFLPYVEEGAAQVRAMPNLTLEDSIARSAAMIRHNANYKKK
jgi:hypothetical protein